MSIPRPRVISDCPARERGSALVLVVLLCLAGGCAGTQHPRTFDLKSRPIDVQALVAFIDSVASPGTT